MFIYYLFQVMNNLIVLSIHNNNNIICQCDNNNVDLVARIATLLAHLRQLLQFMTITLPNRICHRLDHALADKSTNRIFSKYLVLALKVTSAIRCNRELVPRLQAGGLGNEDVTVWRLSLVNSPLLLLRQPMTIQKRLVWKGIIIMTFYAQFMFKGVHFPKMRYISTNC